MTAGQLARRVSDVMVALHEYRTYVLTSAESLRHADALDAARARLAEAQSHLDALATTRGER